MKKRGNKAQAAMQYILTYGWAILIVLIVLSLLFYLGVFSPKTSGSCFITAPFVCRDYMVNENSVGALLSGKSISSVTVNSIKVNGKDCVTAEPGGMGGQLYSDTALSNIEYGGQAWIRCVGIKNNIGQKTSVNIDLGYVSKSGLQHSIIGYVSSSGETGKGTFDYTHVIDNNIVLSYDFEDVATGTGGVKDLSGKGNHGTMYGSVDCTQSGVPEIPGGKSCSFTNTNPANSAIHIPQSSILNIPNQNNITIEAWVKEDGSCLSTPPGCRIITKLNIFDFNIFRSPQKLYSNVAGGTSDSTNSVTQGSFTYVAVIFNDVNNANTKTFYINNIIETFTDATGAINQDNNGWSIGARFIPPNTYNGMGFNGKIDSLVIYNKVLSSEEIKDHFCYTQHSNPTYQTYCST